MPSLLRRLLRVAPALVLLGMPAGVQAQIGHLPELSPYREIRHGRFLELIGGQLAGSGGPINVGPHDGPFYGARVVFRGKHTIQLGLSGWTSKAQRFIVDADAPPATRTRGPIDQRLTGGDFSMQLNLTGGKSYHGLAPFASLSLGMVVGEASPPADSSGYKFGTKFYFAPAVGTRYFLGQRLYIKGEARAFFWSLKYPASYADEPSSAPGTAENPNAVNPTGKRGEYVPVPALLFGLGVKF